MLHQYLLTIILIVAFVQKLTTSDLFMQHDYEEKLSALEEQLQDATEENSKHVQLVSEVSRLTYWQKKLACGSKVSMQAEYVVGLLSLFPTAVVPLTAISKSLLLTFSTLTGAFFTSLVDDNQDLHFSDFPYFFLFAPIYAYRST